MEDADYLLSVRELEMLLKNDKGLHSSQPPPLRAHLGLFASLWFGGCDAERSGSATTGSQPPPSCFAVLTSFVCCCQSQALPDMLMIRDTVAQSQI